MANEEFEKRMESSIKEAEQAVARLAKQIAEDSKKTDTKIAALRALQDRDYGKGRSEQTGQ